MPVGRKPKPTHLHVIEGTRNATRHRKRAQEPQPIGSLARPPAWLTRRQREVWVQGLRSAPRGLLKAIDASVYLVWVVACDAHRQAVEQIAAAGPDGLVARTATRPGPPDEDGRPTIIEGTIKPSPLVAVMNSQAMIMIRAAAEMGFTPSSRARVSADPDSPPGGDDPEARYFSD